MLTCTLEDLMMTHHEHEREINAGVRTQNKEVEQEDVSASVVKDQNADQLILG